MTSPPRWQPGVLLEADTSEEEPRAGCFLPEESGSRQRAMLHPRLSRLLFSTREGGRDADIVKAGVHQTTVAPPKRIPIHHTAQSSD